MYDLWNYWFSHQKSLFFEQMQLRPTISTWCYDLRQKCLQRQITTKLWAFRWGMSQLAALTCTHTFGAKHLIFGKNMLTLLWFSKIFYHLTQSNCLLRYRIEFLTKFCIENMPLMSHLSLKRSLRSMMKKYFQNWDFPCF